MTLTFVVQYMFGMSHSVWCRIKNIVRVVMCSCLLKFDLKENFLFAVPSSP